MKDIVCVSDQKIDEHHHRQFKSIEKLFLEWYGENDRSQKSSKDVGSVLFVFQKSHSVSAGSQDQLDKADLPGDVCLKHSFMG